MLRYCLILFLALYAAPAYAVTTIYADDTAPTGCSTPTDNDYDPRANSGAGGCGSGSANIYIGSASTGLPAAIRALTAGDTLYIRGGTYTPSGTYGGAGSDTFGCNPTCPTGWDTATSIRNYPSETVTIVGTFSMDATNYANGLSYLIWEGDDRTRFIFDGTGLGDSQAFRFVNGVHHIRVKHTTIQNYGFVGIGAGASTASYPANLEVIGNLITNNGNADGEHGIYFSSSIDALIEHNNFVANFQYGAQFYNPSAGHTTRPIIRYNRFEGRNGQQAQGAACIFVNSSTGAEIYNNLCIGKGSSAVRYTHGIQLGGNTSTTLIANNTIYDVSAVAICVGCVGSATLTTSIINNIVNGVTDALTDSSGSSTFGTVATNICAAADITPYNGMCPAGLITTTPGFITPGTTFSLAATSIAINAGTAIAGHGYNGSAPDIGAFESFSGSSASIDTNIMDITLGMSLNTPLLPSSSITGFTVSCTGSGCGTPTVSSASRKTGSDTIVRLTISGITGNACAVGQTWTWTYASGNVTDSSLIGDTLTQPLLGASSQSVTAVCSGSATSSPGTPYIIYELNDGSGTSAADTSGNLPELNGTLTNGPTWIATAHSGAGVVMADNSDDYIAVPYGNTVNPSSQSLTIAFAVNVTAGLESAGRGYFGSTIGTNQRLYISTTGGTWRIGIQSSSDSTASNLSVTSGWHRICLVMNSGTDTATLYVDGVAGTNGALKTYTSYTLASNFRIGSPFDDTPGNTYDEFKLWQSAENCATDFSAWEQGSPAPTGTFDQKNHKFQKLRVDSNGNAIDYGTLGSSVYIVPGGAIELIIQTDCTGANCDPLGQRLLYSLNGGTYTIVPDSFTADNISFYGTTTDSSIVSGTVTCCLSGALTTNDGITIFSSAAIPSIDMTQNSSVVQRYVVRFDTDATAGDVYTFKIYNQNGNALSTYTTTPTITITPMSIGIGF